MAPASPSITIERAYEVSFAYSPDGPNQQLCRAGMTQAALAPKPTYRAKTSIGRPSTARNRSDPFTDQNDPICPGPMIRRSQDNMDLHEALRSYNPPFKQSKRWAKAYAEKEDQAEGLAIPGQSLRKKRHIIACDASHQSPVATTVDATGVSDSEPEHYGLCGPAHVPGWQTFKQHRLLKRHSAPTSRLKLSHSKTVKQKKSVKSLRARMQTYPRRVMVPKVVPNKSKNREDQHGSIVDLPSRLKKQKPQYNSHQSLISALTNELDPGLFERSGSPVSSLHDYEKVKRFSQECVDMLSGLDFGDDWRASVIGPSLSVPQRPLVESPITQRRVETGQASHNLGVTTMPACAPCMHGVSQSFYRLLDMNSSTSMALPLEQLRVLDGAQAIDGIRTGALVPTSNANDKADVCHSHMRPTAKQKTPRSSFNRLKTQTVTKDLKSARSIDTLTEIEAQVVTKPSADAIHQLHEKSSSFTLSSSPKRQRPSGEPPERPLPELPNENVYDGRSTIYTCPSCASSRNSRIGLGVEGRRDSFVVGTVHAMFAGPACHTNHPTTPIVDQLMPPHLMREASSKVSHAAQSVASSRSLSSQSSTAVSIKNVSSSEFKLERVASERSLRIQEMKKRHVATWNKNQHGAITSPPESGPNRIARPVQHKNVVPIQISSSVLDPAEAKATSRSDVGTNISRDNRVSDDNCNYILSPIAAMSDDELSSINDSKAFHVLAGTLSEANCTTQSHLNEYRKPQPALPSCNPRPLWNETERPNQLLAHSQIMVVVDTNPHTYSFRASTLGASTSTIVLRSRPASPVSSKASKMVAQPSAPESDAHQCVPSAKVDNLAELIDIVKPPTSMPRRHSSRTFQSQGNTVRSIASITAKKLPKQEAPSASSIRKGPRSYYYHALESSDSELENSPLLRQNSASPPPRGLNASRATTRRAHKRKDTPLTAMLKEEVRRADQELENLKKYEQRIEYLQVHLDQTLKVWGRMSQNGKRQYLSSTFRGLDKQRSIKSKSSTKDSDTSSIAPSSIYSVRSSVQVMDEAVTKSLDAAIKLRAKTPTNHRRVSGTSTVTRTATDVDSDASGGTTIGTLDKRASAGSLTDPQDYDLPSTPTRRYLDSATSDRVGSSSTSKQSMSETLGTNLDDLRARLQASTRPPVIPARRCRRSTPPYAITVTPTTFITTTMDIRGTPETPSRRWAVAPWEQLEEVNRKELSNFGKDDQFGVEHKGLRTDQMDAMLAL